MRQGPPRRRSGILLKDPRFKSQISRPKIVLEFGAWNLGLGAFKRFSGPDSHRDPGPEWAWIGLCESKGAAQKRDLRQRGARLKKEFEKSYVISHFILSLIYTFVLQISHYVKRILRCSSSKKRTGKGI